MHVKEAVTVSQLLRVARVTSANLLGLELQPVFVEVALRRGPPQFDLSGLAETSVREARIRVRSAVSHLGLNLDEYALSVSLAPATLRKSGSSLDLALAVALLEATGQLPEHASDGSILIGELSLDGALRPIAGVLPMLVGAAKRGIKRAFVPRDNAQEASHAGGIEVLAADTLSAVCAHLRRDERLEALRPPPDQSSPARAPAPPSVYGQRAAKRALLVAAAGHHHLLLVGSPGAGKSLLARTLPHLLPPLALGEALETTSLHSIAGLVDPACGIVQHAPFRAPHHTVSDVGLIGGGNYPRPGEISLAHNGVLFLDELPEFRRSALEALRQPLEDHEIHLTRAKYRVRFPAHPLVIAAMNPCPCGQRGNPKAACVCSEAIRKKYLDKLSGPLLERIDLHVAVPPAEPERFLDPAAPDSGDLETQRTQVDQARAIQRARWVTRRTSSAQNGKLSLQEVRAILKLEPGARALLEDATRRLNLSGRTYVRVLRVARTIADLDDSAATAEAHVGEALQYRMFDPRTLC